MGLLAAACADDGADEPDGVAASPAPTEDNGPDAEDNGPDAEDNGPNAEDDWLNDLEPATFRVSTLIGPTHPITRSIESFSEAIEQLTDGKLTYEMHHSSSLVGPTEVLPAMRDGLIELTDPYSVYMPDQTPVNAWAAFLAFVESRPPAGSLAGAAAHLEWTYTEPEFREEYAEQGTEFFGAMLTNVRYELICDQPVTSLSSAQGKSVRVGGNPWAEEVAALGMEPAFIPGNEVYEAAQRGVIDCVAQPGSAIRDFGISQVLGHSTALGLNGWNTQGLAFEQGFWDGLPAGAQQAILDELVYTYMAQNIGEHMELDWRYVSDARDEDGVEFHDPDQDLLDRIEEYRAGLLDGGLAEAAPSELTYERAQQLIDRRIELSEKWLNIVDDLGYDGYDSWEEYAEVTSDWTLDLGPWLDAVYAEIYAN